MKCDEIKSFAGATGPANAPSSGELTVNSAAGQMRLMQGADRDLVKVWQKMNAPRFDNIMLKTKTKTVGGKASPNCCLMIHPGPKATEKSSAAASLAPTLAT